MAHLGRVPLILYQGSEHAAAKVAAFREAECPGERLDDGLAATLMRFHLKRFLDSKGIDAQLDEDWSLEKLPFLGISLHYNDYHVRILKGAGGILPGCGTSERKIRFYGQIPSMYLIGPKPHRRTANLLVLWDFNPSYGLSGLWLALPSAGAPSAEDVSSFRCEPIPHPSEGLSGVTAPPPLADDDLDGLLVPIEEEERQVNER